MNVDCFARGHRLQSDDYIPYRADRDADFGLSWSESCGGYDHVVGAGKKIVQAKLTAIFAGCLAQHGGVGGLDHDFRRRNAAAAGILHNSAQGAARGLGMRDGS